MTPFDGSSPVSLLKEYSNGIECGDPSEMQVWFEAQI
jgi:hypothetical protein